jgi:hypothetical protein
MQNPNRILIILKFFILPFLAPLTIEPVRVADLPKRRRACRSMGVHLLIEPRPDHAALRPHTTNLNTLTAPSLLSAVTRQ